MPWNASWTAEDRFEIRPCKYAEGRLAMWQPFAPHEGDPIYAKPHFVRQRRSVAQYRCTVCGEVTPPDDRWTFGHGRMTDGVWATMEAPVHHACAQLAQKACPVLRSKGLQPFKWPKGSAVIAAILGGEEFERDFGIETNGRSIVGCLKFAWPTIPHDWNHQLE